ncbi:hypothetical protein LUZ60_012417 [Juncus effusus]|nr:hypothetical protein LUZ60_012417 [Juncus effusus]
MKSSPLYSLIFILLVLIFTSSINKSHSKSTYIYNETEILLHLKSDLGNPVALNSWDSISGYHCNWNYVTCTDGYITELILSNLNITGLVPEAICQLKNLSYLDLSDNDLLSAFPHVLYNCSLLQHLDLSQNYFIGELPSNINSLSPSLSYLNLGGNNFTGDVPKSVGMFPKIKQLHLEGNLFDGSYPAEIGNLSTLEYLSLAWNSFLPTRIPPEFGNLTNLLSIWMTRTNIIGEIPNTLSNLTKLEHLDLAWNNITGTIPSWIWSLENLNILYLYSNKLYGQITGPIRALGLSEVDISINNLTGPIPDDFGQLRNLSVLHLYYNNFLGEIPTSIGFLPMLYDIRLFNNKLNGTLPPQLGKHSQLWVFEVSNNHLSGELPKYICYKNALVSLVMFNNNFSGEIPDSLANCSTLNNIQLSNNRFSGEFPSSIWSLVDLDMVLIHDNEFFGTLPNELPWNLTRLEISNNRFTGSIPSSAHALQFFEASNNALSGQIPQEFSMLARLSYLDLGGNQISGSIPPSISMLGVLTVLNLSRNQLTGSIPDSLGSLQVLTTIDLSENHLSGIIPPSFNNSKLNFLNLSVNQLSGMIPNALLTQSYSESFLSNPDLCTPIKSIFNFSVCINKSSNSKKLPKGLLIGLISLFPTILITMVIIGFLISRRCCKWRSCAMDCDTWKITPFYALDFTVSEIIHGLSNENIIGRGGSGSVYKICLDNNKKTVLAVKKICDGQKLDDNLEKQFQAEVQILGTIRHPNIVKLLCYISCSKSKLLVYEYMEYSSIDRWLHRRRASEFTPLDWPTRLNIAIDAARGLCYMHHDCSPPIVHRDIKSSNILVDAEFKAKVADFGLARVLLKAGEPETVSAIAGSFGYMAPEYGYIRKINQKVDVYSFGVVLLELTTGRRANHGDDENQFLADWAWHHFQEEGTFIEAIDKDIRDSTFLEEIVLVFRLGLVCTSKLPPSRPSMREVLKSLTRCENKLTTDNNLRGEYEVARLLHDKGGNRLKGVTDVIEEEEAEETIYFSMHIV